MSELWTPGSGEPPEPSSTPDGVPAGAATVHTTPKAGGALTVYAAASLKAALSPAPTGYLYFVAKGNGSGGHHFSTTMEEHERAVHEYRRAQK